MTRRIEPEEPPVAARQGASAPVRLDEDPDESEGDD